MDPNHNRESRIRIGEIERILRDRKNDISVDERSELEIELAELKKERQTLLGEKAEACQACALMGGRKKTRRRKKAKRGKTAKRRKTGKRGKTNKRGRKAKRHVTKKRRHNHKGKKGGTNEDEELQIEAQLAVATELLRKQEQVIKMEQEKYHRLQHKLQKLRQQGKHSKTEAEQSSERA